ncbi:MAG: hypothetical protein ACYDH8_07105 [Syntrophales bacterium]
MSAFLHHLRSVFSIRLPECRFQIAFAAFNGNVREFWDRMSVFSGKKTSPKKLMIRWVSSAGMANNHYACRQTACTEGLEEIQDDVGNGQIMIDIKD